VSEVEWTDPASELATICLVLAQDSAGTAADFLSLPFETTPYSEDFFKVLFAIRDKISELAGLVEHIPIDPAFIITANTMIREMAVPLDPASLQTQWTNLRASRITAQQHFSLGMLSGYVQQNIKYPKLNESQSAELIKILDELRETLGKSELNEVDFVRDAAIRYIDHSKFIVKRLTFFGWRYGLYSLRELVLLYFTVENMTHSESCPPQVIAFHQRLGAGIDRLSKGFQVMRDWRDNGALLFQIYGAGAFIGDSARAIGLLPGTN
jgi:hypothetical protein